LTFNDVDGKRAIVKPIRKPGQYSSQESRNCSGDAVELEWQPQSYRDILAGNH
jgi:hypothetical protein